MVSWITLASCWDPLCIRLSLVENYIQKNCSFFDQFDLQSLNNYIFFLFYFATAILKIWGACNILSERYLQNLSNGILHARKFLNLLLVSGLLLRQLIWIFALGFLPQSVCNSPQLCLTTTEPFPVREIDQEIPLVSLDNKYFLDPNNISSINPLHPLGIDSNYGLVETFNVIYSYSSP